MKAPKPDLDIFTGDDSGSRAVLILMSHPCKFPDRRGRAPGEPHTWS